MMLRALIAGTALLAVATARAEGPPAGDAHRFDAAVAPLLARRCLECHAGGEPAGGLDLSRRDSARAGGDGGPAVVPGEPEASLLWRRIAAGEMPPEERDPLTSEERAVLKEWIAAGAAWGADPLDRFAGTTAERAGRDWWAFRPIVRHEPPAVKDESRVGNAIDRFVLARLERAGLSPSPEADRRTLVRRLYFDLIGLPPSPDEVDAFLADESPDAYDRLVDRLLESPHYGERWARHWLDVVRFGESAGFQRNKLRPEAWKYRDWVILALNDDVPYDEFVKRQLAGDLLDPNDPVAAVGTGYLVTGPYDRQGEDGSQRMVRQTRHEELAEQVATLGQTFLGLTIHCARCHDHKFDPVPQREYYQVAAALATFRHNSEEPRHIDGLPAEAPRRAELGERIAALRAELAEIAGDVPARLLAETESRRQERIAAVGDDLARFRQELMALHERLEYVLVDPASGRPVAAEPARDSLLWILPWPYALAAVALLLSLAATFARSVRRRIAMVVDPRLAIAGIVLLTAGVGVSGWHSLRTERQASAPRLDRLAVEDEPYVRKRLDAKNAEAALKELEENPAEVAYAEIAVALPYERRDQYRARVSRLSALEMADRLLAGGDAYAVVPNIPPEPLHVLARGDVDRPGETVSPSGIAAVPIAASAFGLPADAPDAERRTALAEWITDPQNPLAPRVIVNRIWQHHFGQGLVATPNDFGFKGAPPSHPQLLDWLAAEFIARGWRLKDLHRQIVTSATYRQASQSRPAEMTADPDNRLLWRYAPRRHDAEVVRDSVLSVSGLLTPQVGGPGYRDFEGKPPGATDAGWEYGPLDTFDATRHRRTIYRTWIRGVDNPLLSSLDCADPSVSTPQRTATTTPLQALSLMNDSFMTAAAAAFAERIVHEAGTDPAAQVRRAWELAYGRPAQAEELPSAIDFARAYGLPELALVLFNSNEFLHAD